MFFKRQKRFYISRIFNFSIFNDRNIFSSDRRFKTCCSRNAQLNSRCITRNSKWRLLNNRGHIIIELLLVTTLVTFLSYAAFEYWVVMSHYQNANHILNKYLSTMSLHGRLTDEYKDYLIEDFDKVGLKVLDIKATEDIVLRDIKNPESSKIFLEVAAVPKTRPLVIGGVLKNKKDTEQPKIPEVAEDVDLDDTGVDDSFKIVVRGEILSEKVNYD